jgi:hypothetical protein
MLYLIYSVCLELRAIPGFVYIIEKPFFEIYIGNNKASLFAKSLWINYFEKAKK